MNVSLPLLMSFFPNRGHLVALKLSPNLRKPHKEAKGADAQRLRELEVYKMERLIATSNSS